MNSSSKMKRSGTRGLLAVLTVALLHVNWCNWSVHAENWSSPAAAGLHRGLLQSSICQTVSRCGLSPNCMNCTFTPVNGRPTCTLDQVEGVYKSDYMCNQGFVKAIVNNRAGCKRVPKPAPKRTTGLNYRGKGLGSSQREQIKKYTGLQDSATRTRNAGASTPEQVRQAACTKGLEDCPEYEDVLLLTLMPTTYSSNNTADTGGYAYISAAQDQEGCNACVGFVATAAAEAAVNIYMKQNWDMIGLSEQDVSFCRLEPRVNCASGSSYDQLVEDVGDQTLQQWASRDCYPYKARVDAKCKVCTSHLPPDGVLSMAYGGNALPSIAAIKEQILLNGGVMTSLAVLPAFAAYRPTPSRDVYNSTVERISDPNLHAVFCYGWNDTGGWFLCKNSWGTSWGLQGSFKIAYGAAFIMQPDYTFALQFGPSLSTIENNATSRSQLSSKVTSRITLDPKNAACVLHIPEKPIRLAHLQQYLFDLANYGDGNNSPPLSVSKVDILEDLVLNNAGQLIDLAVPSNGPFKFCGKARELMPGLGSYTNWNDADAWGSPPGTVVLLTMHDLLMCNVMYMTGISAMSAFKLETWWGDGFVKIRFTYQCSGFRDIISSAAIEYSTPPNEDGSGNTVYLDRHDVSCPANSVLQRWLVVRPTDTTISVKYWCKPATVNTDTCEALVTDWNDDGDGQSMYLDRHFVSCPPGKVLTRWRLETNGPARLMKIAYTCCA